MPKLFSMPCFLLLFIISPLPDASPINCDSITKNIISEYDAALEKERKEHEIILLNKELETQKAILKSQRAHTASVVLGIVSILLLFACIGLLILAVYYKRKL